MKIIIEIILVLIIKGLISSFFEKKKLAKFNVPNIGELRNKIDAEFKKGFNGTVTTKDILTFAFTIIDVTDAAIYEDSSSQIIFVKLKKHSVCKPKQVINMITDFIQSSNVVYPRTYKIDVNVREARAREKGNVINVFHYAESMGLAENFSHSKEETAKHLKIISVPVCILAVLLLTDFSSNDKTIPPKAASNETTQQEQSNKTTPDSRKDNKDNQTEVRKIYVEPETVTFDVETEKWIACTNEEMQADNNKVVLKPGTEKFFPELNALVIGKSESTTLNATPSAKVSDNNQLSIIGSNKDQILSAFKGWNRIYNYENNVDPNALKFENEDLIVVVDFNDKNIAEGVCFLSNNIKLNDIITGENSYVNNHYDELVQWATGGKKTKIEKNKTTQYPVELYIGNVH